MLQRLSTDSNNSDSVIKEQNPNIGIPPFSVVLELLPSKVKTKQPNNSLRPVSQYSQQPRANGELMEKRGGPETESELIHHDDKLLQGTTQLRDIQLFLHDNHTLRKINVHGKHFFHYSQGPFKYQLDNMYRYSYTYHFHTCYTNSSIVACYLKSHKGHKIVSVCQGKGQKGRKKWVN